MNLFDLPAQPAPAPPGKIAGRGMTLRYSQREDVDALMHAIETGHTRPCCVAATGYGKMLLTAETAGRLYAANGKVLCLVDRSNLVYQAADEWERHLGCAVGRIADGDRIGMDRKYVISTVQAMYTPDRDGKPLYEYREFEEVGAVIIDEGHKFFAPCFRTIPEHFADLNGAAIVGFTATPVASNGDEWSRFFNWTPKATGPCMRTVPWCIENGFLVPMRQAWVNIDLKLSELYEAVSDRVTDSDEEEDADSIILDLLTDRDEQAGMKFAAGVAKVIGDRQTMIFSPPRVEAAKTLASWLKHVVPSDAVWGARADKYDVLDWFARGTPQSLCNVNMLCEGANFPNVSAVFICRLIKNWRLVQQMVGRCLRPATSVVPELNRLDGPENAPARREAIANSVKPDALIADLVGLDEEFIHASAIEVMFADQPEDVRKEAADFTFKRRKGGISEAPDETLIEQSIASLKLKQHQALAEMVRRRAMNGELPVEVNVTYDASATSPPSVPTPKYPATDGQVRYLIKLGYPHEMAKEFTRKQAGGIIGKKLRYKPRQRPDAPMFDRTNLNSVPVSQWQRDQLRRLGHTGALPSDYASATRAIRELSMGVMA